LIADLNKKLKKRNMITNTPNIMKNLILLLLLFTGLANAQIVNIPDANFKAKLLAADVTNQIASADSFNLLASPIWYDYIKIDSNNDGEIQISEALLVRQLDISNSNIADLTGISSFPNLQYLNCGFNQLTTINVSQNTFLISFKCTSNQISVLDVSNLSILKILGCSSNLISSLDISNLNLQQLLCQNNQLSSLEISSSINLYNLNCSNNQLISLDITGLNLQYLNFSQNQITNFNFPMQLNMAYFNCSNNNLTQIDVSKIICDNYDFSNNPNLTYLNMKNGHQDQCVVLLAIGMDYICSHFLGLPNLQFICVDEGESVGWTIPSNISMSSYCSFTPGGNYNTISGTTKYDSNANGCDINDPVISNVKINITDGTNSGSTFTNNFGNYNFYTIEPNLNIVPILENPTYFNSSGSAFNFLNGGFGQTGIVDFCISPNGNHADLEVVLAPITPARPGFDAVYQLIYKNKGNQTLNGVLSLNYDVFRLLFISSNTTPDFNFEGTIDWNFTNLLPFEARSILVTLNVNSPTETPAVTIGDILNFTTSITPVVGDDLPLDNTFMYNQTVVGSFDPNNIECLEGTSVAPSEIGKYLHYAINFENTGNFPAENVVVKTIIDPAKYDINSLQLLDTSNPVDARITGNVVEFIFKNVQLAGPGGHGHVLLKVKSKNSLIAGDSVANRADIFFDYNAPVDTGLETTVFQSLSNSVFVKDDSVSVSPNPASSIIAINCNSAIKTIQVYDVQGRVLQTVLNTNNLDISDKTNGVYFLKITTEKGSKVEKIIKE
jgi:uncharacterized repeat protein (TIGR01451 family)